MEQKNEQSTHSIGHSIQSLALFGRVLIQYAVLNSENQTLNEKARKRLERINRQIKAKRSPGFGANNPKGKPNLVCKDIYKLGDALYEIYLAYFDGEIDSSTMIKRVNSIDLTIFTLISDCQVDEKRNGLECLYVTEDDFQNFRDQHSGRYDSKTILKDFAYSKANSFFGGSGPRNVYNYKKRLEKEINNNPFDLAETYAINFNDSAAIDCIKSILFHMTGRTVKTLEFNDIYNEPKPKNT